MPLILLQHVSPTLLISLWSTKFIRITPKKARIIIHLLFASNAPNAAQMLHRSFCTCQKNDVDQQAMVHKINLYGKCWLRKKIPVYVFAKSLLTFEIAKVRERNHTCASRCFNQYNIGSCMHSNDLQSDGHEHSTSVNITACIKNHTLWYILQSTVQHCFFWIKHNKLAKWMQIDTMTLI